MIMLSFRLLAKHTNIVMGLKKNVYEKRKVESNLDLPSTLRFS